jgi:hypothetical protein
MPLLRRKRLIIIEIVNTINRAGINTNVLIQVEGKVLTLRGVDKVVKIKDVEEKGDPVRMMAKE